MEEGSDVGVHLKADYERGWECSMDGRRMDWIGMDNILKDRTQHNAGGHLVSGVELETHSWEWTLPEPQAAVREAVRKSIPS